MALDTRLKRSSAIGSGLSFLRVLPPPDSTISAADRRDLAYCYAGLAPAPPSTGVPFAFAFVSGWGR
jgi:hypothetical protein